MRKWRRALALAGMATVALPLAGCLGSGSSNPEAAHPAASAGSAGTHGVTATTPGSAVSPPMSTAPGATSAGAASSAATFDAQTVTQVSSELQGLQTILGDTNGDFASGQGDS